MSEDVLFVGVMGYSGTPFDKRAGLDFLRSAFDLIEAAYPDREIRIVSGYTALGIPLIAYQEATRRNWKTVGVACEKARKYEARKEVYPCGQIYIMGENWGEESPLFLNLCHVFVRVGGGEQSLREIDGVHALGKPAYEYELARQDIPNE